ncbi:response regulator [Geomonas sp. Red32]|uniref:response regulator n=1 Tax=Geomonas sp. Red32 TaxID=2912856 RepID=UPI00202CCBA9|nr:response regulator [Geomonas sp. Red32]MCM0082485.1 response regulator [Geomonas sp. Red32]
MNNLILTIDDDDSTHEVLGQYLELAGYRVNHAWNGAQGLDEIARETPDLVLLDVQMPELDGFQTIEKIRQDPAMADVPVLFLTSLDRSNLKIKGLEMGADDYMVKPFVRAEVLARVKAALRRSARAATPAAALTGELAAVSIAELLQTMEAGRRTCTITFPELQGTIYLENGVVVHSVQGAFAGIPALQRMFFLERGKFKLTLDEIPPEIPRAPTRSSYLVLDCLTYLDELVAILGNCAGPACQVVEVHGPPPWVPFAVAARLPLSCREFLSLIEGDLKENAAKLKEAEAAGAIALRYPLPAES